MRKRIKTNPEELMPERKGPVQTPCVSSERPVGTRVRKSPDVATKLAWRVR